MTDKYNSRVQKFDAGGTFVLSGDESNFVLTASDGYRGTGGVENDEPGTPGGAGGRSVNLSLDGGTVVIDGTFNGVGGQGGRGGDGAGVGTSASAGDGGNGGRGGTGSSATVNDGTLQIDGSWTATGGRGGNGGNIDGLWDETPAYGGTGGSGGSIVVNGGTLLLASDAEIDLSGGAPGTNGLNRGQVETWMDKPSKGSNGAIRIDGGTLEFGGADLDDILTAGTFDWRAGTVRLTDDRTIASNKVAGLVSTILAADKNLEVTGTLTVDEGGVLALGEGTATIGDVTAAPAPGTFRIAGDGNLILDGGTISCGSLDNSHGGTFQWNTGSLTISGDLAVGQNVVPTVNTDTILEVGGILSVESGGTLALDGGKIECRGFDHTHGGSLTWTTGTLAVTGDQTIESYSLNPVKADMHLEIAQTLGISSGGSVSLAGGRIACEYLVIEEGGLLSLDGGTLEFTSPGASAIIVDGGTLKVDSTAFDAMVAGARFEYHSGVFHLTDAGGYTIGANDGLIDQTLGRDDVALARGGKLIVEQTLTIPAEKSMYAYEGTIEAGAIVNEGAITVFHGQVTTNAGLTNHGELLLVDSTVDGPVSSPAGNAIHVVGDVYFTGQLSGGGGLFGSGTAHLLGGYSPGDSPAEVAVECSFALGDGSTLSIELAGLLPGEFDRLVVEGDVTLGGMLDILFLDGFEPGLGDVFEIIDVGGDLSGTFDGLGEGDLVATVVAIDLRTTYAGGDGNDVALMSVPEPSMAALAMVGALLSVWRRRRR